MARFEEIRTGIVKSYLNSKWNTFNWTFASSSITAMKFQTDASLPFYFSYRTYNKGRGWLPYVSSKDAGEYAGYDVGDTRHVQAVGIQVIDSITGARLDKDYIVMYRAYAGGEWLPWVSNASPELMYAVASEHNISGELDTASGNAGTPGSEDVMTQFFIRVFKDNKLADTDTFTGGEVNASTSYLIDSTWNTFNKQALDAHIDGIKVQTSANKGYYLLYKTWNEGKTGYYPAVKSTEDDYAGSPGKPIQRLNIQVYKNDGTKLASGVVVMYRACVDGKWLPWVSNADPEWMRAVQTKHRLDGTLDTASSYAGAGGKNVEGIEIRIFEDDSNNAGTGSFEGAEAGLSMRYMANSATNWNSFNKSVMASPIDGIEIRTSGKDYYLQYKTWNEGKTGYYPAVKSTENDYAGSPGKPIQRLSIEVYRNDGTKLTTGVVVMYRVYVEGRWLSWVSNAAPEWMQNVKAQYNLDGALDVNSGYAGISGKNIEGVEVRVFEGSTLALPEISLPGAEATATMSYLKNGAWNSFNRSVLTTGIDGVKIQTSETKPYYLSYKTWNAGKTSFYPAVKSTENDYAGYPGKAVQRLAIQVYRNDGTKLTTGVVVMYRAYVDGAWLPWVSNADPEWMEAAQVKYALGGRLDTASYYAGIGGKDIEGLEVRIFEENSLTVSPTGNYKIINVPFITQMQTYPTGCESVSTVMALKYAGVNISVNGFIDNYLDKQSYPFDPNETFGGNPYLATGYGCYAPVIKKALDKFLPETGYAARALYNKSLDELCSEFIDNDIPVIIWATMGMKQPYVSRTWTYNGKTIQWIAPEHCLVLVGYDDNHYIFNDPQKYSALTYYSKEAVKTAYNGLWSQAVVIVDKVSAIEVSLNRPSTELTIGELIQLRATVTPANATIDNVIWTSSNASIASVSNRGLVTANSIGVATITATVGQKSATCKVTVLGSRYFGGLGRKGYILNKDVEETNDNFYISTKNLSSIFLEAGIKNLIGNDPVEFYYDDWYLFAIRKNENTVYGLCKMREEEFDGEDNDEQGVTISFVKFDLEKLLSCLANPTTETKKILEKEIDLVVAAREMEDGGRVPYDSDLREYFKSPSSKAPYLVAEIYVKLMASMAKDGEIDIPANCKSVIKRYHILKKEVSTVEFQTTPRDHQMAVWNELNKIKRIPDALEENNKKAGYNVSDNNKIFIEDSRRLTQYEKYAILMTHTANVTFNSFAAEVVYHADMLENFLALTDFVYLSALRADMAFGEERESGVSDQYYDLESKLVQDQIEHHGEY